MLYSELVDLLSRPELASKSLDSREDRLFVADFLSKELPKFIMKELKKRLIDYPGEGYINKEKVSAKSG